MKKPLLLSMTFILCLFFLIACSEESDNVPDDVSVKAFDDAPDDVSEAFEDEFAAFLGKKKEPSDEVKKSVHRDIESIIVTQMQIQKTIELDDPEEMSNVANMISELEWLDGSSDMDRKEDFTLVITENGKTDTYLFWYVDDAMRVETKDKTKHSVLYHGIDIFTKQILDKFSDDDKRESTITEGNFEYKLYLETTDLYRVYYPTIKAKLTYIGEEDEVTIQYDNTPFYFSTLELSRGKKLDYELMNSPQELTLKKGIPLSQEFHYDKRFLDVEAAEILLRGSFATGLYQISGYAIFTMLSDTSLRKQYELTTDIQIFYHTNVPIPRR